MSKASNNSFTPSIDHFFRGAFSIDIALFTFDSGQLQVLLQEKYEEPFVNEWGLPGKLILPNEDTDAALDKLLDGLLGTHQLYKKQIRAFSEVGRHPLGRVISFAYYGLIPAERLPVKLADGHSWRAIHEVQELCYDHNRILSYILYRFKKGLLRHPNVFELLPKEFTIPEMIAIFEQLFDKKLDPSNFGRQVRKSELVIALDKFKKGDKSTGRPPQLFSFDREKYRRHYKDKIQFNF